MVTTRILLACFLLFVSSCMSLPVKNNAHEVTQKNETGSSKNGLWSKPVVQAVKVPATIRGGVYIPEHIEYVIVKPGEYIIDPSNIKDLKEYKMESIRAKYNIPLNVELESPSGGMDIVVSVYKHKMDLKSDSGMVINIEDKPFLLKNRYKCFMLYKKEPIQLGSYAYAFDINGKTIVVYKSNGSSVEIENLSTNEAFVSTDGYLIKVEQ